MNRIAKSLAAILVASSLSVSASRAEELTMLTLGGPNHTGVANMAYGYIEMVREMSNGDITVKPHGPDEVPAGEQLRQVSAGAFDLIYTHGLFHTGETGIGVGIDAVHGDIEARREKGIWDWVDRHYRETLDLKVLAIPTATAGFRLFLKEEMDPDTRLSGKNIQALPYHGKLVTSLGATAVALPFGELYSAAERGVIDGLVWPSYGAVGLKFHEVAPYLAEPAFGTVSYLIMMDLDKWNGLDPATRETLLEAGRRIERDSVGVFNRLLAEETAAMRAGGARMTTLGYAREEADRLFADRAIEVAIEKSGRDGEAFRDFVRSKGMLPQ